MGVVKFGLPNLGEFWASKDLFTYLFVKEANELRKWKPKFSLEEL